MHHWKALAKSFQKIYSFAMRRSTGEKLYEIQIAMHENFWFSCAHLWVTRVDLKKHYIWFFHNRICCHSVFSSEVLYFSSVLLYGCQNCKVHYSEDIISGQPAKTVLQNMQMRARTDAHKTGHFVTHSVTHWVTSITTTRYLVPGR